MGHVSSIERLVRTSQMQICLGKGQVSSFAVVPAVCSNGLHHDNLGMMPEKGLLPTRLA